MLSLVTILLTLGAPTLPAAEIPIYAWYGIPAEYTSVARYAEMREAGFTGSIGSFPSLDAAREALDAAGANDIELILACPELRSDTEATVDALRDHPALEGYIIRDEPGAGLFPQLGETVARLRALDPDHPAYINLFPTYASSEQLGTPDYETHVSEYLRIVKPEILSFDHYPVVRVNGEDVLRSSYFQNLAIIRDQADKAGLPFWAFALSVAHDPYPVSTETHLRIQQFSNLFHGAAALQYFTYWTPVSNTWAFHTGPITPEGKRTVVYDRVRRVTDEIQDFAPVFAGAKVEEVTHLASSLPEGCEPFVPDDEVTRLEADQPDHHILVSRFANAGHQFLALMNVSMDTPVTVAVALSTPQSYRVLPGGQLREVAPALSVRLSPGRPAIFSWAGGELENAE